MARSDFDENYMDRTAGLRDFIAPIPPMMPFDHAVRSVESQSPIGKFAAMNMEAQQPGSFVQQAAQPIQPPQPPSALAKFLPFVGPMMNKQYEADKMNYATSLGLEKPLAAAEYLARSGDKSALQMLLQHGMDAQDPLKRIQLEQAGYGLEDTKNMRAARSRALETLGGVSPLTAAQIQQESGGNPNAVSSAGAAGIMQIMPETARDPGYGVKPLQGWDGVDPRTAPIEEQIRFGEDYRNAMIREFGSVEKGLQAYNAGPGKLGDVIAGRASMPAETAAYAPAIMNRMEPAAAQSPIQQAAAQMTPQMRYDIELAKGGDPSAIQRISAALAPQGNEPLTEIGKLKADAEAGRIPMKVYESKLSEVTKRGGENIPGFKLVGDYKPSDTDTKEIKAIAQAKADLVPLFEERRRLIAIDPSPLAGSTAALDFEQNSSQIALTVKNLEQTGALDKGSVDVILASIGDPVIKGEYTSPITSIVTAASKGWGGKDFADKQLDRAVSYVNQKLDSAASARGYQAVEPTKPKPWEKQAAPLKPNSIFTTPSGIPVKVVK